MKDRFDPLIAERAPWLHRQSLLARATRPALERLLAYPKTVRLGQMYEDMSTSQIMDDLARRLAQRVTFTGLSNLPRSGGALIVANHPTGIADGVVLHSIISQMRPDLFFFANRDIMRVLPQFADYIAPVEWREDKRSREAARETMAVTRAWMDEGRLGVIFPSGRLAKRRWLTLHERPWMSSAARLARKFDVPVIPINIRSRNSFLFYLFDLIHPTLRDITLFHETLNKDRQPYRVTIGAPISPSAIPSNVDDGIALLRDATLALDDNPRVMPPNSPFRRKPSIGY